MFSKFNFAKGTEMIQKSNWDDLKYQWEFYAFALKFMSTVGCE